MYKIRDFLFVLLNNVQTKRHVNKQGKTVAVVNKQWDLGSGKVAAPAFHRRYFTTRSLSPLTIWERRRRPRRRRWPTHVSSMNPAWPVTANPKRRLTEGRPGDATRTPTQNRFSLRSRLSTITITVEIRQRNTVVIICL